MQLEGRELNDEKKNRPVYRRGCGLHRNRQEYPAEAGGMEEASGLEGRTESPD